VRGGCLASLAARLGAVGEAFDKIEITTIQYWYGRDWAMKIPTEDLILAEFSLIVSTRIRWGHGVQLIVSDVKPIYACVGNRKRILTSSLRPQQSAAWVAASMAASRGAMRIRQRSPCSPTSINTI